MNCPNCKREMESWLVPFLDVDDSVNVCMNKDCVFYGIKRYHVRVIR